MLHTLSSGNFISETTSTKTEKEKIQFENLIEGFFRNVFHVDNNPKDHLNQINPKKGEIDTINDKFNLVSLSFVISKNVN
jgi:hypothetical protein